MNRTKNVDTRIIDLGLIEYAKAWDYQTSVFNSILEIKKANRDLPDSEQQITPNYLLFCEHPPVYTLGKSGHEENLLASPDELANLGAAYVHTNRGGDITFHGPGQLVVYPVIDLENFFTDIHRYMRNLEEAVILTLAEFSLHGDRIPGLTGVWIQHEKPAPPAKICAMGVKTSRWVTMHGLALNIHVDLKFFDRIVPCGITDKAVTSLEQETGKQYTLPEVSEQLKVNLARVFSMNLID